MTSLNSDPNSGNSPVPLSAERGDKANDLRNRIAAALYNSAMSRLSWPRSWGDLHPVVQQIWLDDADLVIRELDMGIPCATNGCRIRQIARRHANASGGLTDSGDAE